MQDGATPTALDVQEPQKPADVAPLQLPKQKEPEADGMVNKADRIIPQDQGDKPSKSKFGNTSIAKQLTAAELNARLNVDELDESKIKIKEAWQDGNDTKIKLANGDTIQFGRDSEGYASIGVPPGQPADVTTMMSMAEIARAKGWKDLTVSGSEEFRALSYFVIKNAGLKMNNPPEASVLEQYRDRFEQTLATGIDPVTAERQAQKDLAGVSDKPIAPAGTKTTEPEATAKAAEPDRKPAEPDKKPRPAAKAAAPVMR
jgi:hypothetical protein